MPRQSPGLNIRFGLPGRLIRDVWLLCLMINDFLRGRYRRVPVRSLVMMTLALLYILFPLDILPDYLPGYGQIDDVFLAFICIFFMEKDLTAYNFWRNEQSRRT